jgi:hypothetical protein
VDREDHFPPGQAKAGGKDVPNLKTFRGNSGIAGANAGMPVPGGLGGGTLYDAGRLKATKSADLRTWMIVHPSGIGALTDWVFTTATNRTEMTIEVVGIYNADDSGSLGIFDWSCSPSHPCLGGSTGAAWIWTKPFSQMSCYWQKKTDPGGHEHRAMHYSNKSEKMDDKSPPLWRNRVTIYDDCTDAWHIVYTHYFRANQKNCSVDNACGWWGPILENFIEGTKPGIKEVGFWGSDLWHNGTKSSLDTDDTHWTGPPSPWKVYHRNANRSWGIGTNTTY